MRNKIIVCRLSLIKIYLLVFHVLRKFRDSTPVRSAKFACKFCSVNVQSWMEVTASPGRIRNQNRPFPSCFEPHYESEAKYKVYILKISFHNSYPDKKFPCEELYTWALLSA